MSLSILFDQVSKEFYLSKRSIRHGLVQSRAKMEKKLVIKNLSFEINKGEKIGLYGPNGSGKSTLLRLMAGIYRPSKGNIEVNGDVAAVIELGAGLNFELSGLENISLYGSLLGMTQGWLGKNRDKIIKFSGLKKSINYPLKTYSTGMKARLAFSIVAFAETEILLLDEVFSVGDKDFLEKSRNYFQDSDRSQTIVISSHNQNLLYNFCDRVLVLEEGSIKKKNKYTKFFQDFPEGQEFVTRVVSNSMYPLIKKGDLIRVVKRPFKKLQVGDIVAVFVKHLDQIVVHRLILSQKDKRTGERVFLCQGDRNFDKDAWSINENNYVGLVESLDK